MNDPLAALLREQGWEPDSNVCRCGHPGGDHDLNNWCLVCQPPRSDYFASSSEAELWANATARLRDAGVSLQPAAPAEGLAPTQGFAADRPTGPRTEKGHALASRLRTRMPDAEVDWDAWIRAIEDAAEAWGTFRGMEVALAAPAEGPNPWVDPLTCAECGAWKCIDHGDLTTEGLCVPCGDPRTVVMAPYPMCRPCAQRAILDAAPAEGLDMERRARALEAELATASIRREHADGSTERFWRGYVEGLGFAVALAAPGDAQPEADR